MDDEPWDEPGPTRSEGAAGVGFVNRVHEGLAQPEYHLSPLGPVLALGPTFPQVAGQAKGVESQAMAGIDPPATMKGLTETILTGHLVAGKQGTISAHGPRASGRNSGDCTLGHRVRGGSSR